MAFSGGLDKRLDNGLDKTMIRLCSGLRQARSIVRHAAGPFFEADCPVANTSSGHGAAAPGGSAGTGFAEELASAAQIHCGWLAFPGAPVHRLIQQLITSLVIIASLGASAFAQQGRGPSTPQEEARIVQLAATADQEPMATMASADGRWFEKWVGEAPDYMIGMDKGAFWFMTKAAKGELKQVMRFHHALSTAAFQVKNHISEPRSNPAQMEVKTLAGVEGLLRAYESLLAKNENNRSAKVDEAIAARNAGTLAAFVKALPPVPER